MIDRGSSAGANSSRVFAAIALAVLCMSAAGAVELRVATYNATLSPDTESGPGSLVDALSTPSDDHAQRAAEIIQRINPDILLVNEFNWDPDGKAAELFAKDYLGVGHDVAGTGTPSRPIAFAYRFLPTSGVSPFNTGLPSGVDLDHNGRTTDANDAFGFGQFPGQYGLVVFSKYPILTDKVRTLQQFRWQDMPGNLIPTDYYSPEAANVLRLSSKSHWDIPIDVNGKTIHILASHPTPPVFDGKEDRNGRRNHDEIRFWHDYITPGAGDYIYDDAQFAAAGGKPPAKPRGGLAAGESFIILGDQNADPLDGQSYDRAINQLLTSPRIKASPVPTSAGGPQAAQLGGGANDSQKGDPATDTAAFGQFGNLRVDYVLPSADLDLTAGHVFWFADTEPLFKLVTHDEYPSDHRAVYIDIRLP